MGTLPVGSLIPRSLDHSRLQTMRKPSQAQQSCQRGKNQCHGQRDKDKILQETS